VRAWRMEQMRETEFQNHACVNSVEKHRASSLRWFRRRILQLTFHGGDSAYGQKLDSTK